MSGYQPSYLILGAGVFGVSTAYYLIKKYPNANVTIVDRDSWDSSSRVAASWDWNKVVRADYDDLVYCKLGLEAQDIFEQDPLWQPYFHKTGIWWACRDQYAGRVIGNYDKLGREADLKAVSVEDAKKMYGGLFEEADMNGVKEVLVNKTSGWAAAGDCLKAVTAWCLSKGVKYIVADVQTLTFVGDRCSGVRTVEGRNLTADKVIVAAGAYTAKLLEYSAQSSGKDKLRTEGRIVAGGICTGMTRLNEADYARHKDMPVGVQGYTAELGPFIGSLPPTPDRELKWWGQTIFYNNVEVLPGRVVSAPPAPTDYRQWNISKALKEDIDYANHVFYGSKGAHWKFDKYRICWDAFSSSSDFIITPQPAAENLYIATCGSFHGWKFFPVLGKYVMQMIEGDLEQELVDKWHWDANRPAKETNPDFPRHDMRDLGYPGRGEVRL